MAKDVITVDGEDRVVREDTAKSYRGVMWALTTVAIILVILAVLAFSGALNRFFNGNIESPSKIESTTRQ